MQPFPNLATVKMSSLEILGKQGENLGMRPHRLLLVAPLAVVFSTYAQAAITVHQLKTAQGYIVLKTSGGDELTQGSTLDAPQGGEPCKLKIYFVKGAWAGAQIKECPAAQSFAVGQELVNGNGGAPEPEHEAPRKKRDADEDHGRDRERERDAAPSGEAKYHHLGVHAYYSTATTINERYHVTGDDGSGTGPQDVTTESTFASAGALGVGVRYTYVKRYDKPVKKLQWGGMVGFSYDFPRKIAQRKTGALVSEFTDLNLKVSEVEANLVAEYNGFYGLLGPNLSFIVVDGQDADPDKNYSGTLGLQVGAGYSFGTIGIEGLYRTINGSISSAVIGLEGKAEQERLWGFVLRVRADFTL
jgi:hypothetical protein